MGINDRDYVKNDSWQHSRFNESKGEIEFETQNSSESKKTHLGTRKSKLTPLQEKNQAYLDELNAKKKYYSLAPWIIAFIIILMIYKVMHKNSNNEQSTTLSPPVEQSSIFKSDALPMPQTSVLSTIYDTQSATCPFTLIADNKNNYYVKLCDAMRGDKTIAKFFIRAGGELKVKVPAGNYKIKFGSGDKWYGQQDLFGKFSRYGESGILTFEDNGYTQNGNTISFYNTVSGNLHTKDIGRNQVAND